MAACHRAGPDKTRPGEFCLDGPNFFRRQSFDRHRHQSRAAHAGKLAALAVYFSLQALAASAAVQCRAESPTRGRRDEFFRLNPRESFFHRRSRQNTRTRGKTRVGLLGGRFGLGLKKNGAGGGVSVPPFFPPPSPKQKPPPLLLRSPSGPPTPPSYLSTTAMTTFGSLALTAKPTR